jgi:V-type H+-transporting ATPase subunit C
VVLSDDLAKADGTFEAITVKIADNLKSLLNHDVDQWRNNLAINESRGAFYLTTFATRN